MKILKFYKFITENVGKHVIADITKYNEDMSKGLADKLYFFDHIKPDCIVDFGCANGIILKEINNLYPDIKLIGYDLNIEMINQARINVPNAFITNDWSEIEEMVKSYKTPMVLLSSVIHEVYSYSLSNIVSTFWKKQIFSGIFKYVVIRDMMPSNKDINSIPKSIVENDAKLIKQKANANQIKEYESYWEHELGPDYRHVLSFLLKYHYTDNWERENRERYIPISVERFLTKIPSQYKIIYEDHFKIQPLNDKVKSDFGVEFRINTHSKFILERV